MGNVSNQNQEEEVHTTHTLDGISGNVSNQNQAEEVTHTLDEISCRQCQQSISSRGGAHNSHAGWDFMQAMSTVKSSREAAHNSQSGWDFIMLAIKIKQRRCTQLTSWMGNVSNQNQDQAEEVHTTHTLGFHAGNVSNHNQAEEVHTTHMLVGFHAGNVSNQLENQAEKGRTTHNLDEISFRQCQQSKSSRGGAHNSHAEWDFMQAMSAMKIKQRRCTQLTHWMRFHAGNVGNRECHGQSWGFPGQPVPVPVETRTRHHGYGLWVCQNPWEPA